MNLSSVKPHKNKVIIIGGGIIGASIYRDCALRGFKPLLFERFDFGSETTAGSSKLAHGGIRYLSNVADWPLVLESLQERRTLKKIAPHLVHDVDFLLPVYDGALELPGPLRSLVSSSLIPRSIRHHVQKTALSIGLTGYDFVAGNIRFNLVKKNRLPSTFLNQDHLVGVIAYDDAKIRSPERLCIENIIDGDVHGGSSFNYTEVVGFEKEDGKVMGVIVKSGTQKKTVYADVIINAAGPQIDTVNAMHSVDTSSLLLRVGGIHVVVPDFKGSEVLNGRALVVPSGKRIIFVIPEGDHWVIGTTESHISDTTDAHDVVSTKKEVDYLFTSIKKIVPVFDLNPSDVLYSYVGVRPLTKQETDVTYASRKDLFHWDKESGVISVSGKLTPSRYVAEHVVDRISPLLHSDRHCTTAEKPLPGGKKMKVDFDVLAQKWKIPRACITTICTLYGSRYCEVLSLLKDKKMSTVIGAHTLAAQIVYAVRNERAVRLSDVMLRRTLLGPDITTARKVCMIMARELQWSSARTKKELDNFKK